MNMHLRYVSILLFVTLCLSCNSNKGNDSQSQTDSINIKLDNDSSSVAVMDDYDWTPEEFKNEHHDEWVVVKQSINIQQREGEIDFNKIDSLVKEYIQTKKIKLPKDKYLQIKKIEDICVTKFDISGYDDSNMGMHIADGTARLFEEYVNWLLVQEAMKVKKTGIDIQEEEKMFKYVIDALSDYCDTIGGTEGTSYWMKYAEISRIDKKFRKSIYVAVIKPEIHKSRPLLLTSKHFKEECEARSKHYEEFEYEGSPSPKTERRLMDRYYLAMKQWLEYRDRVERGIANPVLKADYAYITRSFAREQYIHLKNKFKDIGFCGSPDIEERLLRLDCSDREMLDYSHEKAFSS